MFYDPSLSGEYPVIFYVISAIGIFLYQTLDALDGKQARRIKAYSPLGQLFDHGCDSFSAASVVIQLLVCLRLESTNLQLATYLIYISIVYMSNLCEHYTEVLHTSYAHIGVTEVQLGQIALQLLSAARMLDFIYAPVILGPFTFQINELIAYTIVVGGSVALGIFFQKIYVEEQDVKKVVFSMVPMFYIHFMSTLCVIQYTSL